MSSTNNTFYHNNYEIDIVKRDDNVTITCLDKALHKSFQEIFTEQFVNESLSVGNLHNFFEIINYSLDNKMYSVVSSVNNIELNINYSNGLKYNFSLILFMIEQTQLNSNSLYIKKLEEHVFKLENKVSALENKVSILENKVTELKECVTTCIGYSSNASYSNTVGSMIFPIYFDTLNITLTNGHTFQKITNSNYNNYLYVSFCRYDYATKILNIEFGHNNCCTLYSTFSSLKPKQIKISDNVRSQLTEDDMKFFPKEHN